MTRQFTVYIMQLAHTDIGYTHPQEIIERMYLEFYDRVLTYCRETENEPPERRFKWTCETFWQVQHYLLARPEREEEFLHYVRAGQIEITAAYLHFTDMIDTSAYRLSLKLAVDYCQKHNLPLKSAIHSDINGWPWGIADLLAEENIPYFCSHINGSHPLGERGSIHYMWHQQYPQGYITPDAPIGVPRMFWWQGPHQGKVLHWLGEHYHLGNILGLSGTLEFPADKSRFFTEADRMTAEELYATARQELPRYLKTLRAAGYPYDMLLLTTSGFLVDNSPPDRRWCEIIARWNEEHTDIRLRSATISEWFEDFQGCYPETEQQPYPLYQMAWPDYWAYGLGSVTMNIAQARQTQRKRDAVIALVDASRSSQAHQLLDLALEQERFSLEHTFGAWSAAARPASPLNAFQHAAKELMFHRATLYLNEAANQALRDYTTAPEARPTLYVSSHTAGAGLHTVHFYANELQLDPHSQVLCDPRGRTYPFQSENEALRRYVAIVPLEASSELQAFTLMTAPSNELFPSTDQSDPSLESAAWQLRVDSTEGHLLHMRERAIDREWIDEHHQYGFGQLIHERIIHPWGRQAASDQARLLALDVAGTRLKEEMPQVPVFAYEALSAFETRIKRSGPVFDEIQLCSKTGQPGDREISWRVYHHLPIVELQLSWNKPWSDQPEAAYVAFPFAVADGSVLFETGGGFFHPGNHESAGQLPGTCPAYYTVQRAVQIHADNAQLLWLPLDAPLVMPNAIDFNQWETTPWQWNGFLASMPVNHYWHTNFASSQRGPLHLRYRLFSPRHASSREEAIQTALPVEAIGWR